MSSDIDRQLRDVWNWLPTFRAVAETEHLPTAAERLHVTPAAVSRTIRQLEERLDKQLFNRDGRSLVLNDNGRTLLEEVRSGMLGVEQGLKRIARAALDGPVRVSAMGVLTDHFVTPALLRIAEQYDGAEPILKPMRTEQAARAVLRGEIDVAFFYEPMTFEGVTVEKLGETTSSVYCGRGHPLFETDEPSLDQLLEHPFSVPGLGDTGRVMDDWPTDLPRQVGMRIMRISTNLTVCRRGQFLTVLPDMAAREALERGEIRRFRFDLLPPTELFAARRQTDDDAGGASEIIDTVGELVSQNRDVVETLRDAYP
jgi:DNA-binding transcriptional LysR family regulator